MSADPTTGAHGAIGYVLKMYPRFSETFVVSEILAREAAGERIVIFSLRPPNDARFHPELARVAAPVIQVRRPSSAQGLWECWREAARVQGLGPGIAAALPELLAAEHDDATQAVAVARLAAEHGVGHLHAHFATTATTVARLAGRVAGLPYSFTAHAKDIFHEDVDDEDLRTKLRDAHHAVTISDFNLAHLRERCGDDACARLSLVRNGLELARFPYRPRHGTMTAPRLVSVGRLVEKKGFPVLIDAVATLHAAGVPCTLDILGDGPLREELATRVHAHGLDDAVALRGPCTQTEVREALYDHDLFVAPYVAGADGNVDGLPTVLLEAMACGTPCVAAEVTAVPEAVLHGETGWLVPSGDVTALAGAVGMAIAPGTDRSAVTDAARALVERLHDSAAQADALRRLAEAPRVGEVAA